MGIESFKIPVENGDSEASEDKLNPAESEEMLVLKDRIKDLQEKGDDLNEEEVKHLGEIIAGGDKVVKDYEARNRFTGDEGDGDTEYDPKEQAGKPRGIMRDTEVEEDLELPDGEDW